MVSDAPSNLGAASEVAVECSGTCKPSQQAQFQSLRPSLGLRRISPFSDSSSFPDSGMGFACGSWPGEVWFY